MLDNKKETAHTNQSAEQSQTTNEKNIQLNYTPKKSDLQADVLLSLIGYGADNAIHLADLVRLTGLESRIVRKRIETLRRSGCVIAADEHGYYYPTSFLELSRYIRRTERQAKSILFTLKAARRKRRELANQKDMPLPFTEQANDSENSAGGV